MATQQTETKEPTTTEILKELADVALDFEAALASAWLGQDHFELHPQLLGTMKRKFEKLQAATAAARKNLK